MATLTRNSGSSNYVVFILNSTTTGYTATIYKNGVPDTSNNRLNGEFKVNSTAQTVSCTGLSGSTEYEFYVKTPYGNTNTVCTIGGYETDCSGSGGGGDSDCEDIYPVNLEGLSYVCSSSYWNIAADTSTEKAITITPIQWFESSQLMRLQVNVKMASSYSRKTGGRITKITLTDSVGNTGTISFTASSGNQFINGNGTNIWSGTKDFYWPSGKTKTFSVTVAWATYSDYEYSSDGCIETWYMDNNGNGSKTGIVATYTGSIEGLEFYWKTSTDRPVKDKEIADYITAAKWNSLCNSDKVNLSSLANKTSGVSKIIGTEVRQILLALGGSSSTYPLASFQPNQPVLAKWFTDIEDLYNS